MSIRILTDSAADLEPQDYAALDVELIPLTLTVGGRSYAADQRFNKVDFFRLLEASDVFPTTSQPAPADFEAIFEDVRQKGDTMIFISIAGVLSGTNQTVNVVKGMGEYDDVYIVDSCSATLGQKQLVLEAVRLRSEGKSAPEIVLALEALKKRIRLFAGLDTLEYLRRGGRLSGAAASIGTLARIKPVVTLSSDGSVSVAGKSIGKARAMKEVGALLEKNPPDPAYPIFGLYAGNSDNLLELSEKLGISFAPENQSCIGPIIGAHIGPGAYGIVYIAKE